MEGQNFSKEIFEIMNREMGYLGEHIVKNQCYENGILYSQISWDEVPKLSRALAEVMVSFGEEKANKIFREIENLVDLKALIKTEQDPLSRAKMLSQLGDSAAITGDLVKALIYYETAKSCADGIESAIAEIDKRIGLIETRARAANTKTE